MPKKFDGFRRDVPFPAENLGTIWRMRRSVSPSSSSAKPSQTRSRTFRVLARQLKSVVCRFRGFSTFMLSTLGRAARSLIFDYQNDDIDHSF
jgi:hypothetical protein